MTLCATLCLEIYVRLRGNGTTIVITYKGKNGRSRCRDNDCYLCLCYHCLVRSFDGRTEMCILSESEIKIFFFFLHIICYYETFIC